MTYTRTEKLNTYTRNYEYIWFKIEYVKNFADNY